GRAFERQPRRKHGRGERTCGRKELRKDDPFGSTAKRLADQGLRVGKIAGNGTNLRPHLNCCDPDLIHDYSPPAFRWSINLSDIDSVKRPRESMQAVGAVVA